MVHKDFINAYVWTIIIGGASGSLPVELQDKSYSCL